MESLECRECSHFIFKVITPITETVSPYLMYMYRNILSLQRPGFQWICLSEKGFGESEKFQTALKLFLWHSCMLFIFVYNSSLKYLKFLYKMLSSNLMKSVAFKMSSLREKTISVVHFYSEQSKSMSSISAELKIGKSAVHKIIKKWKKAGTIDDDQRVGNSGQKQM